MCKECNEKVSTFMELLKHVAKNHAKETVEETKFKEPDEKDFVNQGSSSGKNSLSISVMLCAVLVLINCHNL